MVSASSSRDTSTAVNGMAAFAGQLQNMIDTAAVAAAMFDMEMRYLPWSHFLPLKVSVRGLASGFR